MKKKKSNLKKGWLIAGLSLTGALSIGCFTASMVKLVNDSHQQEESEQETETRYQGSVVIDRVLQKVFVLYNDKYEFCKTLADKAKNYIYDYSISSKKSCYISNLAASLIMTYADNGVTQLSTLQKICNDNLDNYITLVKKDSISDEQAYGVWLAEYRVLQGNMRNDSDLIIYSDIIKPLINDGKKLIINNSDILSRSLALSVFALTNGVWESKRYELGRETILINFVNNDVYKSIVKCTIQFNAEVISEICVRTCEYVSDAETQSTSVDKIINLAKQEIQKLI